MKISILSSDLSSNCVGRAYLLAKVLQRRHEVEILGPAFGKGIWPPCDTGEFVYKVVRGCNFPRFFSSARELLRQIEGDVVYAVKPRLTSFGIGLMAKKTKKVPLVLDIDDWDYQGKYTLSRWRRALDLVARLHNPYGNLYLLLMERLIPRADAVTTVSSILQEQFGGKLLPHGRDTNHLDPACYSGKAFRQAWGLEEYAIAMFLGSPKPHKGLEDLISAIHLEFDLALVLVVVGAAEDDPYTQKLSALGGNRVHLLGMQPFTDIPHFLAAADLVVLPQRDIPFARAQVPAKIFDAMAMARPIVATAVGDLPHILEGCGLIVPPADVPALGEAMRRLVLDPPLAQDLGRKARQRCIERYSWDVMEQVLRELFQNLPNYGH